MGTLQDFTLSLLAYKGALVEAGDGSTGVLLGADLAAPLGLNEYERLVFDPSLEAPGTLRVDYDSPTFERMGRLVDSMGRIAYVSIPAPELRPIDPEQELETALRLQNGVFRFRDCARVTQIYFRFLIQYDAMADDRSGGVVDVWVNPATRSTPRMDSLAQAVETRDAAPPEDLGQAAARAWKIAAANAPVSVRSRLAGFVESLTRRRQRDIIRMRDYYTAIDEEIRRKIARTAGHRDAQQREIERLAATARAYQGRAAEVLERYRVRVRVTGVAALAMALPAYQIRVQLLRRSAKAEALFSWNPFDRRIEPRCCDACRRATPGAAFCDDRVHYLCPPCLAPCPLCSKSFCRACHTRCPRSHKGHGVNA